MVPPEMTNGKIREALLTLAGATITRVNKGIELTMNVVESNMTSILRYL